MLGKPYRGCGKLNRATRAPLVTGGRGEVTGYASGRPEGQVWPLRCRNLTVKLACLRGVLEPKRTRNRASQVGPPAFSYTCFPQKPRRKGQGVPGIRDRLKRRSGRRSGGGAPPFAAIGTGSARNPQRASSYRSSASQSFANASSQGGQGNTCGRLPPLGSEVLTSTAQRLSRKAYLKATESRFSGVKCFSHGSAETGHPQIA